MPQDWAKFLTCRSGNYKKMPEVLALAGCIPIMLGRQGINPRKSTLVDLVTKKDASGRPGQPCGEIKMTNDDAGNIIMQCTWYFLPLAAWALAMQTLPDLFDMCTKALLKLLFSTLCANMEEARYLFQRLNQWDAPLFDFNDLWSSASFTDSDFKAEHSLAKVKDFVGVQIPRFRIILYQELAAKKVTLPPPGCSKLDMPWALRVSRKDLDSDEFILANFSHLRQYDMIIVNAGQTRDSLESEGFACSSPKDRTPKGDGSPKGEEPDIGGSGSRDPDPAVKAVARRGAGGGVLGAAMRVAAGKLKAMAHPEVKPEVQPLSQPLPKMETPQPLPKTETPLPKTETPRTETTTEPIELSSTEASPVKVHKMETDSVPIELSSTEASPVKEHKMETDSVPMELSSTEASPIKMVTVKVPIELSSTEASPVKVSKMETTKVPIKQSSIEASTVKMSNMEMAKALQDYVECTNTQDLAAALESISKHGSVQAAIQAFFREKTLPTASADRLSSGLSSERSSHMDRLLNAPQTSGAPMGTASFEPFTKDLTKMASKDDVLHTMEAERNCLANRVFQERYHGEVTPGLYMHMQAESKINRSAQKSKEEVHEMERSKRAADNMLGPAQIPDALDLLKSKNGTEEKGKSKKSKGQHVDGHAGDPGAKDFPESDKRAYELAVTKVLLGEDVTMIGEMMSKGKRAYNADGSNTMILLGTNGMSYYEDKFLSTNHYFKAGTDNEAGNLQTGWMQKRLFLQVGGIKAIASNPNLNPYPITLTLTLTQPSP